MFFLACMEEEALVKRGLLQKLEGLDALILEAAYEY
jgi:hypothetical protein